MHKPWHIGYLEAIHSIAGWVALIGGLAVVGAWLGLWAGQQKMPGLFDGFTPVCMSRLLCVLHLPSSIACAVTALAVYLPIRFDSIWLCVVAAGATLVTCLVIVAAFWPLGVFGC
jgi:hypothetical protein